MELFILVLKKFLLNSSIKQERLTQEVHRRQSQAVVESFFFGRVMQHIKRNKHFYAINGK